MPSDKLTRREVDFVLRRAAEIDTQSPTHNDRATDETLSVVELVRLGEEAGLRGEAVQLALTELRRGAPLEPEENGTLARTLGASRVETILSQEDGTNTAVTFNIDLSEMRRERLTQMGLRAAMAFALLGLGGAAIVPSFGVYDIFALANSSVTASGIFALERRRYMESRSRVALAPERFLDLLAVRQQRKTEET